MLSRIFNNANNNNKTIFNTPNLLLRDGSINEN